MFFPSWYQIGLLALESGEVVQLRLGRICAGGQSAMDESVLMMSEKVDAACEAGFNLLSGDFPSSIVNDYREHVAANAERLKVQAK